MAFVLGSGFNPGSLAENYLPSSSELDHDPETESLSDSLFVTDTGCSDHTPYDFHFFTNSSSLIKCRAVSRHYLSVRMSI